MRPAFFFSPILIHLNIMFDTVLLPLSLRESSALLERIVTALKAFGAREIVLLHVRSGPVAASNKTKLEERASAISEPNLRCRTLVRSGSVASTVALTAAEQGCDLIAFPWRRKSWIQRSLVGSVTKDIVRLSDLPVFVYKQARSSTHPVGAASAPSEARTIMYATDFQDSDRVVIPYLRSSSRSAGDLLLIHVGERAPDPAAEGRRIARVQADLDRLAEECRESGATVRTHSVVGRPRSAIVRQAYRNSVGVLVIGKADSERAITTMLGSTAEAIAYNAPCSVLIVPRTPHTEARHGV